MVGIIYCGLGWKGGGMGIAARVTCEYFFCQGNDGVGGFSCLAMMMLVR